MTESEISFEKVVEAVKKIHDITLLNPEEFDKFKMSVVSYDAVTKNTLCIPFEANFYRLKMVQYIRTKSKSWKLRISDEFIFHELDSLIFKIKLDKKSFSELGKTIKNWIEELKELKTWNLRYVLPVNNVDYRKDIEFDGIKLKKISIELLKELISFSSTDKFFTPEKTLEDLKLNDTEIFAIIDIETEEEKKGYELAQQKLKRLIHAMRLFDPPSGITEREFYFPETKYPYVVVNLDNNNFSSKFHNLHLNAHIWRTAEYWQRVQPDWEQLCSFLYSPAPNQLESIILTALYWYGDAGKETEDSLSKFLKYMHGLETLLIFDSKYDKGERMSSRLALINSKRNSQTHDFFKNLMAKYYKFRSGMIHAGKLEIDNEDVATTHEWLRNLLFEYIRFSKKYSTVHDLFKIEFTLEV